MTAQALRRAVVTKDGEPKGKDGSHDYDELRRGYFKIVSREEVLRKMRTARSVQRRQRTGASRRAVFSTLLDQSTSRPRRPFPSKNSRDNVVEKQGKRLRGEVLALEDREPGSGAVESSQSRDEQQQSKDDRDTPEGVLVTSSAIIWGAAE
ncbi:hypothetical protein DVH05_014019 [Phytophthora capsici]|nr:hypothetical protein DVH05_014019 [Phytophthora capsici]